MSQGDSRSELESNLQEALNLYLDEADGSPVMFPLPKRRVRGRNVIDIDVDPHIALAFLVKRERLKHRWTQKRVAELLGIPLYSYQRLESARTANPEWKTLIKLRNLFPKLNLNEAS